MNLQATLQAFQEAKFGNTLVELMLETEEDATSEDDDVLGEGTSLRLRRRKTINLSRRSSSRSATRPSDKLPRKDHKKLPLTPELSSSEETDSEN